MGCRVGQGVGNAAHGEEGLLVRAGGLRAEDVVAGSEFRCGDTDKGVLDADFGAGAQPRLVSAASSGRLCWVIWWRRVLAGIWVWRAQSSSPMLRPKARYGIPVPNVEPCWGSSAIASSASQPSARRRRMVL